MRKGILAIAAAGSVFALTAAGASSLTVNSGAVPAAGSGSGTNCTATAAVSYKASVDVPSDVASIDIAPTITGTGCDTMPALVKVTWTNVDTTTGTGFAYFSSGLGSTSKSITATNIYTTAALAKAAGTADGALPTVADFGAPGTAIVIAPSFA